MKYFLDTEFHEHNYGIIVNGGVHKVDTIDLISIGIVREDNKSLYRISNDFDIKKAWKNEWLQENVLKTIFYELTEKFYHSANEFEFCQSDFEFLINKFGKTREVIAEEIKEFVGDDKQPEFHAYYADYDWVVFCWLFGRMTDLPKGFPKYCRDLKQMLDDAVGTMPKGFDNAVYDDRAKGYTLEDLKNLPDYPKQENEHNALDDARWNKSLFDFLNSLK